MRILHLGKFYPPYLGGMETFLADLARAQVRQGHEVRVLCHGTPGGAHKGLRAVREVLEGVHVLRVPTWATPAHVPLSPTLPLAMRSLVRTFRPELLHLHMPNPWALAEGLAPRELPRLLHWHADVATDTASPLVNLLARVYRPLETHLLRRADLVLATSPPYAAGSKALAPFREKVRVLPLGIDLGRYPDVPQGKTEKGPQTPFSILAVGRLSFYKGFPYLIRAMEQLSDARLSIVGQGPDRTELAALIRELGLGDRVELAGAVSHEDLCRRYAACDVFCLPSLDKSEAFGVVLMEAMRYGKPLVTTEIPGSGVSWVNRDGESGLVVERGNAAALAGALTALRDDPARALAMGEAGQKRLYAELRIEAVAERLTAIYADLLRA